MINDQKERDHTQKLFEHSDQLTDRSREWDEQAKTQSVNLSGLLEQSKTLVRHCDRQTIEFEDGGSLRAGSLE